MSNEMEDRWIDDELCVIKADKNLDWFSHRAKPKRYTRYDMIQYMKPTRDNWIVECSTVFTKAHAV
jgi:hypothetical protein